MKRATELGAVVVALMTFPACGGSSSDLGSNAPPVEDSPVFARSAPPGTGAAASPVFKMVDREWAIRALTVSQDWVFWLALTGDDSYAITPTVLRACQVNDCRATLQEFEIPPSMVRVESPAPMMTANHTQVFWFGEDDSESVPMCTRPLCRNLENTSLGAVVYGLVADETRLFFGFGSTVARCEIADCSGTLQRLEMKAPPGEAPFTSARDIVSDGDYLYLSDPTRILRVAKDGDDTFEVVARDLSSIGHIAVNSNTVFWTEPVTLGRVYSCPKSGCAATPAIVARDLAWPYEIVVDDERLYFVQSPWMANPAPDRPYGKDRVTRCPLSGCDAPETLFETDEFSPPLLGGDKHLFFRGACATPLNTPDPVTPCSYIAVLPK